MNTNKLKITTMKTQFLNLNFMKTSKFFMNAFLCLTLITSFTSCSDDEDTPEVVEEEEAITGLTLTFTNQDDDTDTVVLTWEDANGDEAIDEGEQTVEGSFTAGEVYDAEIGLFAEDEDFLEEDITADQAAIDAHFFVYDTSLDFRMVRADDDFERTDMNKLGVLTSWSADEAGTGTITIQLFHESPGVDDSDGFGSAEGTDTDIDITFDNVVIENTITLL